MPLQGDRGMISIAGVAVEDQVLGTFSKKHFVNKFHGRKQLAAFDQIGMRFEDGIDLLVRRDLFSFRHSTAGLIDYAVTQLAIVLDLLSKFREGERRPTTPLALPGTFMTKCAVRGQQMVGNQQKYTKLLREYPGADRFLIDVMNDHPYRWRVSKWGSDKFDYVMLNGPMINGTEAQIREHLCDQLKRIISAFDIALP